MRPQTCDRVIEVDGETIVCQLDPGHEEEAHDADYFSGVMGGWVHVRWGGRG